MIEIDKDIPLPEIRRRRFPFDKLGIGDSFSVSPTQEDIDERGVEGAMKSLRSSLTSSAYSYARRRPEKNIKLVVRKVGDLEFRCWMYPADE